MVEVYVNMGRIIKDIVKSTSFPGVQSLNEYDDMNWEDVNINWGVSLSESALSSWGTDSQDTRRKFNFDPERLRVA